MKLAVPKTKEVKIRNQERFTYKNHPVNLDLVTSIEKSYITDGVDGYWIESIPTISFRGVEKLWKFRTEEERDKKYHRLIVDLVEIII